MKRKKRGKDKKFDIRNKITEMEGRGKERKRREEKERKGKIKKGREGKELIGKVLYSEY